MKKMNIYFILSFFPTILWLSCSSGTPYMPEPDLASLLAYFPLGEEYEVDYKFSFFYDDVYHLSTHPSRRTISGTFRIETTDIHVKVPDKKIFYKLKTTFFVQEDKYMHCDYSILPPADVCEEDIEKDFSVSSEYNVMLRDGSLWYVENAPSFEKLDEGDTTLMMAAPVASGGEMNLKLFKYPGFDYSAFDNDNIILCPDSPGPDNTYKYEAILLFDITSRIDFVTTSKYKGISSVSSREQEGGGQFMVHYIIEFKFELIE